MSLSPEERLLLAASRLEPDAEAGAVIRELAVPGRDWDALLRSAVRHGVAPLAHHGLTRVLGDELAARVPDAPRDRLTDLARRSAARNERFAHVLAEAAVVLGDAGIRPLALKDLGPAYEVFRPLGTRPLGDLDLLVRREEFDAAEAALATLGYAPVMDPHAHFTREHGWGHHVRRAADDVWIDLQWNVLQREWGEPGRDRRAFDPGVLYEHATTLTLPVDGAPALLAPSREALLFSLCVHLEGHAYGELVLFCDIAECVRAWGATLDWDALVALAHRFEAAATTSCVLTLTSRLLGAPVPPGPLRALAGDPFRGAAYGAVFGGLGTLHYAVDDIEAEVDPPAPVLERIHAQVRDHAAAARAVYDELDALVADVADGAAGPIVLDGHGEGRRFPDPALPAFGTVDIVVLEEDALRVRDACTRRGYAAHGPARQVRLLDAGAGGVRLDVATCDPAALLQPPADDLRNRDVARRSVTSWLRGASRAGDVARLRVIPIDAVGMLAWALERLGARDHDVLFGVPTVLDVLGGLPARPAPAAVVARAAAQGRGAELARGAALVAAIAPGDVWLSRLTALAPCDEPPAALRWAREGPDVEEAQQELRSAYLLTLCLLEAQRGERTTVLRALSRPRNGSGAPLLQIPRRAVRALPRAVRGGQPREPTVYWLDD